MNVDSKIFNLYILLIDTLIRICAAFESTVDEEIEDYLEELEGDYYTFFDKINIIPLQKANLLTDIQFEMIVTLKKDISSISPNLWNKVSIKKDLLWNKVVKEADDILNSLDVSRRKVE